MYFLLAKFIHRHRCRSHQKTVGKTAIFCKLTFYTYNIKNVKNFLEIKIFNTYILVCKKISQKLWEKCHDITFLRDIMFLAHCMTEV
jgi:hypothetical protein